MGNHRTKIPFLLLVAVVSSAAAVCAQEFWQKKPYLRWSKEECQKLLQDSPWAKRYAISRVMIEPLQTPSTERAREEIPEIGYRVQLRSALPIRQALVRLQQIESSYDEMPPEQRRAFDEQAAKFLGVPFPEVVVIRVAYSSNVTVYDRELAQYWQAKNTELLKNSVFLIGPKGEMLPLVLYRPGPGLAREFDLVFPRQVKGHPLLGPEDKALKLEFPHPRIGILPEARVFLEFKVPKMLVQGQVAY